MSIVCPSFFVFIATTSFMSVWPKINFFWHNSVFFQFSSSNFRNSPICTFHQHSDLILYQFTLFLDFLRKSKIHDCSACKVHFGASYIIYLSAQCKLGSWLLKQHGGLLDLIRVSHLFIAIIQFHQLWNVTSGNEDWSYNCPDYGVNKDRRFNECKTLRPTWWTFRLGKAMAALVEKFLNVCRKQRPAHRSG